MNKSKALTVWILWLCLVALPIADAQQTTKSPEDQKIEELRNRQAELKRQIREELERQNKALEEELARLKAGRAESKPATSPSPVPPSSSVETGVNATPLRAPSTPTQNGNGNSNGAGSATNSISSLAVSSTPSSQTGCKQPGSLSRADQAVCALSRAIIDRRVANVGSPGIDTTREDMPFLLTALMAQIIRNSQNVTVDAAIKSFVVDVEAERADKQFGSDPKSSGTTTLTSKGGIPQVLSWAVENGAAVKTTDGTTVTFRLNPVGFVEALTSQGYISSFRQTENDPLVNFFRRTSVGFSFDTTRGTNPPILTGSKQQLSSFSVRYQFVNQRDPRHKSYRQRWDDFFRNQGVAFTNLQTEQLMKLQLSTVDGKLKNADLQQWVDETNTALLAANISTANEDAAVEALRQLLLARLARLPVSKLESDSEMTDALTKFIGAYIPYLAEKKRIMGEVAKGTLVTLEYTNFREPNAPDLSSFRFIAERGTLGGVDFTGNASLTFYNKRPVGPNIQRIRDYDFSGQLDKRLDDVMGLGSATLSFAGKYQRIMGNAVAFDGTILPNTKGDIAAGQVKLTIPIKDSGIKIPFSITFANRTELIREREVRGNFGFTFDLDTLFAKFKSFSRN